MSKNLRNRWKLMKISGEYWHISILDIDILEYWHIDTEFLGKMSLKIILKVRKNQGFTLSVEDTLFEKPQGESNWIPPAVLELSKIVMGTCSARRCRDTHS